MGRHECRRPSIHSQNLGNRNFAQRDVRDYIEDVKQLLAEGRVYRKRHNGDDVEVSIKIARAGGGDVLDDHEAARAVPVEYEGPDPRLRLIVDHLRRQLKPGSSRK